MKRALLLALPGFRPLVPAAAQAAKKPFAIADLYRLKTVADPQISPDGTKIAFVVTESDLAKGKTNSDLYLMNADGSGLRRLTTSDKPDDHPRWSPDGKSLLFISSRKDGPQVWRLPADLGEPEALTKLSTGVSDAEWSPDGRSILFTSEVFPECGADDACNQKIQKGLDEGALQAHMADALLYRHWTDYRDGKRVHTFRLDVATGAVTDLTPGRRRHPALLLGGRPFSVSPDGREICFVSKRDPVEAVSTNNDLFVLPLAGGEARCLTAGNPAYDGEPLYSPDGRYIAYRCQKTPGYEADRFRLAVYDRQAGTSRVLTEAFDNWVDDFAWTPDSQALYFIAQEEARYPLYRVELATGAITPVIPGEETKTIRGFDLSPDGRRLVFGRDRRRRAGGDLDRASWPAARRSG